MICLRRSYFILCAALCLGLASCKDADHDDKGQALCLQSSKVETKSVYSLYSVKPRAENVDRHTHCGRIFDMFLRFHGNANSRSFFVVVREVDEQDIAENADGCPEYRATLPEGIKEIVWGGMRHRVQRLIERCPKSRYVSELRSLTFSKFRILEFAPAIYSPNDQSLAGYPADEMNTLSFSAGAFIAREQAVVPICNNIGFVKKLYLSNHKNDKNYMDAALEACMTRYANEY